MSWQKLTFLYSEISAYDALQSLVAYLLFNEAIFSGKSKLRYWFRNIHTPFIILLNIHIFPVNKTSRIFRKIKKDVWISVKYFSENNYQKTPATSQKQWHGSLEGTAEIMKEKTPKTWNTKFCNKQAKRSNGQADMSLA